jgi:hypothetical protein
VNKKTAIRLDGTKTSISKLDYLEAAGHAAEQSVEAAWLAHCQDTGTSPDDANAKGAWLAIDSDRDCLVPTGNA